MPVRLFIGNLPYTATEIELREHLSAVAPPTHVFLPVDRATGKPRGFAFVEFAEREQGEEAIRRLHGQPFKGRPLAVSEARARDEAPGPRPSAPYGAPPSSSFAGPPAAPGAAGARPQRNFGPPAPPRGRGKPGAKRGGKGGEGRPKGPIKMKSGGRMYGIDDVDDDVTDDFDNLADDLDQSTDEEQE